MSASSFSVKDKTVVVTGASRGIGRAIAEGFYAHGAKVVFVARSGEMVDRVAELPSNRALAVQVDLTESNSAETVCKAAVARFGRIDVLINNAGVALGNDEPYSEKTWDQTLTLNLKAAFLLAAAAAESMKKHDGGSIVNIASIGALRGFPQNPSYQAAKGGLLQLSRAMARDWAAHNIRVNNVCPGYIQTDMTGKSYADPDLRKERTDRTMLGRWGRPEDIVGACIFLASAAASYITGIDLVVDGGWTAKGM